MFGMNFIGVDEINSIRKFLNVALIKIDPALNFPDSLLKKCAHDHILILGVSAHKSGEKLTINSLRKSFGWDPSKKEPCFYNQDWYINHRFASRTLEDNWYLLKREVSDDSRGLSPDELNIRLGKKQNFPSAILTAYTFLASYLVNKEILWKNDFIWCQDTDDNGDVIYTGRYIDPTAKNKNGFNIHRHLKIRSNYGAISQEMG